MTEPGRPHHRTSGRFARRWGFALLALTLPLALLTTQAGAVSHPRAAAAPTAGVATPTWSSFVDLGPYDTVGRPIGISDTGDVGLYYGVWSQGTFTHLPASLGTDATMYDFSTQGLGLGIAAGGGCTVCGAFVWNPKTGSITIYNSNNPDFKNASGDTCGGQDFQTIDSAGEAAGRLTYVNAMQHTHCTAGDTTQIGALATAPGGLSSRVTGTYQIFAVTPHYALGLGSDCCTTTLVNRTSGTVTAFPTMDLTGYRHHNLAEDGGWVAGLNPGEAPQYVSPAGTISPLPLGGPTTHAQANAINNAHVIAGESSSGGIVWPSPTSAPIVLEDQPAVPRDYSIGTADIIGNGGDVAGTFALPDVDNIDRSFVMLSGAKGISGTVRRGAAPNKPDSPVRPVTGVTVTADGTSNKGAHVHVTGTTDGSGHYSLATPQGVFTVTFPAQVCADVPGTDCKTSTSVTVGPSDPVVVDAVALAGTLKVTVALAPKNVELKLDPKTKKIAPKTIDVTVTVKNTGKIAVTDITAPTKLTLSYNSENTVRVPTIPVKTTSGPKPSKNVGTLKPAQTKKLTYVLTAKGDGVYDVEALLIGFQKGVGRVAAVGTSTLKVGAPALVLHTKIGRGARVGGAKGLFKAGTPFTIAVDMQNLSYTKTLYILPPKVKLKGNAAGGVFVLAGSPLNTPEATTSLHANQVFTINPRATKKAELVIRTSASSDDFDDAFKSSPGGTQVDVSFTEPAVFNVTDSGEIGKRIPANEVFIDGKDAFDVGLDDSSMKVPPEEKTTFGFILAITEGTVKALWNLTIGGVISIFTELVPLAAKGLIALPSAFIKYTELEAELWLSIRNNPGMEQSFVSYFDSFLALTYVNATAVADKSKDLYAAANAALIGHLNRLGDDWVNGDWRGAVRDITQESTEAVGTLVLGTGALARFKPAFEAYKARQAVLFEKFGTLLKAGATRFIGAAEALATLAEAAPGYEFNFTDMARYYGLSQSQVVWLLDFCKTNKIIVTLRSRAAESLYWLEQRGAVLKPEQIKIKTVNYLDTKWLGFGSDTNIGRVMLRKKSAFPSREELINALKKAGLTAQDSEYQQALTRLSDRLHELEVPAGEGGYAEFLKKSAKEGEMELRWNLEDNAVDPSYAPNGYTTYKFRLVADADSGAGNLVAQFEVNGVWRSITGDVDLLSIMKANGDPLGQIQRLEIYKKIAKGPLGLLHPAADTWTKLTKVAGRVVSKQFNFPVKINEFVRGGTVAQFAPDLKVRAVTFNQKLSVFISDLRYRIHWNGGYSFIGNL